VFAAPVQTAKAAAGKRSRKRQTGPAIGGHPDRNSTLWFSFFQGAPSWPFRATSKSYEISYRNAVGFQLNEQAGKLRALCGSASYKGSKKSQIEDRFDDLAANEKVGRNTDTINSDASAERRWIIKPRIQQVAPLIDRDDELPTEIDVKSPLAVQTAKAIRRAQDDRFLQGYFGNAYTGEEGVTAVGFKAGNIVAANQDEAGNAGITLNKLIYLRALMASQFVDLESEMPVMLVTSKQQKDLLKLIQIQSRDYNGDRQVLQSGNVLEFMGFKFVPCEYGNQKAFPLGYGLSDGGGGIRKVPVFVPSGMHWGTWTDFYGKITERDDKNLSTQIYAETCGAAVRLNEDKCYQMLCLES
jgi:hypothetical protein